MDGLCLETYLSFCSRYSLPAPWQTLEAPWAYRTPAAGEDIIERLLARHDLTSLLACGLAVQAAEGRPKINPLLAQPGAPIIALIGPEGVSDVLAAGGCIRGERWPMFGGLDDEHARVAIGRELPTVLLTGALDDAIVLRAIGWIAVPVVGLGELNQHEVELLAQHYGLRARPSAPVDPLLHAPRPDEPLSASLARIKAGLAAHNLSFDAFARGNGNEYDDADRLELVLVKWSPSSSSLDPPESVSRAAVRFCELAKFRDIDVLDVGEWRPTTDDLRRFRLAADRGEAAWLRQAMLESLDRSDQTLSEALPVKAPAIVASPLEQLKQVLADDEPGTAGRRRRQEAIDRCHRFASNRAIQRLLVQADAEPDPLRSALFLQLAQFIEMHSDQMGTIRQSFITPDRSKHSAKKPGRDLKITEALKMGRQILDLAKELNQWNGRRNRYWTTPAAPKISLPPFAS